MNLYKIKTIELDSWQQKVEWPPPQTFCIAVIVDATAHSGKSCCDLVMSGIESGAKSVFCWGKKASKFADGVTLCLAARKYIGQTELQTDEDFVIIAIHETKYEEAVKVILNAWMDNIPSRPKLRTLLVLKSNS